ncbi:hypothetical protein [Flavobacterium davisii]
MATHAVKNLCSVYGTSPVTDSVVQKWYARFRNGKFSP